VWDFIRDRDGEFKKSDIPRAMRVGRIPVKRIPILVDDLIKKGYACLEERRIRDGDVRLLPPPQTAARDPIAR